MQEELDLSAPNKAAMLSLPLEKKWIIWTSRRGQEDHSDLSNNPEDYTDRSVVKGTSLTTQVNQIINYST